MHESTILSDLKKKHSHFIESMKHFETNLTENKKTMQLYFGLYIFVLTLNLLPIQKYF